MGDLRDAGMPSTKPPKGVPYPHYPHGPPPGKPPSVWEEFIAFLKRLLHRVLRCLSCGCYDGGLNYEAEQADVAYEGYIMDEEKEAVENLLGDLYSSFDNKETGMTADRLRALCILTYSDNPALQRSAALCFAELSTRMGSSALTVEMLEPLVVLLKCQDVTVQRPATRAISNFALLGPEANKSSIVESGAVDPLVALLSSPDPEIQCNTCGCVTTLAASDSQKKLLVEAGVIEPLLTLALSPDVRIQRNSTGALLNLSYSEWSRAQLVAAGGLPVLVRVLHSMDSDVQYLTAAAISNMAVSARHRTMTVAVGNRDVLRALIHLLSSTKEKVKCQACLALRNLATDSDNQLLLVQLGCLPALHHLIQKCKGDTLTVATACLRNLSIHKTNEMPIIAETFLVELRKILKDNSNAIAQVHAAGTIRNLAAGEQLQHINSSGCVECLLDLVMKPEGSQALLVEATAAVTLLSDDDEIKLVISEYQGGKALERLVQIAHDSEHSEIRYNSAGIIGQVALTYLPDTLLSRLTPGMLKYLEKFLESDDPIFIHIALWTLVQLLKYDMFIEVYRHSSIDQCVDKVLAGHYTDAIHELAETVVKRSTSPLQ